jgi:cytochrome c oxidase subunit 1
VGVVSKLQLRPTGDPYASQNTYYVVANGHYGLSLGVTFLIFAMVYLVAVRAFAASFRPTFGWIHFALTLVGTGMILSPIALPSFGSLAQRYEDPVHMFRLWSILSGLGYDLTLLGLLVFALAVADTFWRRMRPKGRGAHL